jgi:hypothetical protein
MFTAPVLKLRCPSGHLLQAILPASFGVPVWTCSNCASGEALALAPGERASVEGASVAQGIRERRDASTAGCATSRCVSPAHVSGTPLLCPSALHHLGEESLQPSGSVARAGTPWLQRKIRTTMEDPGGATFA